MIVQMTVDRVTVDLIVRHATVADAMDQALLANKAAEHTYRSDAERAVAVMIYPRCVACTQGTVEIDGQTKSVKELTPQEFCSLPYEIGEAWLQAVIEENPGWALQVEEQTSEKKF
ncbi:hypothetical protein SE15_11215 [Thermanaerothrix daxensis]|uniref:Uncharacterized protein n=1 Tax=Thermanaerothrix daxensis TaxID=869279 RepID=A0A0P6XQA4_9CHLR|nr:hypothetical protein [Thermanaerothrix daxensis]KPL82659.1 hypothetical protein SE15_11215 [Thermanaerothrix daxensis]